MKRALAVCVVLAVGGSQVLMAAKAQQAPTPGPEQKKLGYFVGKWTTEGEMKASPMGPGGKITSTDTCEWFDGGFAVDLPLGRHDADGTEQERRDHGLQSLRRRSTRTTASTTPTWP